MLIWNFFNFTLLITTIQNGFISIKQKCHAAETDVKNNRHLKCSEGNKQMCFSELTL